MEVWADEPDNPNTPTPHRSDSPHPLRPVRHGTANPIQTKQRKERGISLAPRQGRLSRVRERGTGRGRSGQGRDGDRDRDRERDGDRDRERAVAGRERAGPAVPVPAARLGPAERRPGAAAAATAATAATAAPDVPAPPPSCDPGIKSK